LLYLKKLNDIHILGVNSERSINKIAKIGCGYLFVVDGVGSLFLDREGLFVAF